LRHVVKTIMACCTHSIRIPAACFTQGMRRDFPTYGIAATLVASREPARHRLSIVQHAVARHMKQLPGRLPLREAWSPRRTIRCCKVDTVVDQGFGYFGPRCVYSTQASESGPFDGSIHRRDGPSKGPDEQSTSGSSPPAKGRVERTPFA
jgi:hypothetical protein